MKSLTAYLGVMSSALVVGRKSGCICALFTLICPFGSLAVVLGWSPQMSAVLLPSLQHLEQPAQEDAHDSALDHPQDDPLSLVQMPADYYMDQSQIVHADVLESPVPQALPDDKGPGLKVLSLLFYKFIAVFSAMCTQLSIMIG